ncbi:MAG TPA: rRNA methyltransferase, partial [Archangium sp.]|nr:rRNA methyltransferase [Archangium sp.]
MKLNLKSLSLPELQQALAAAEPSAVAVRKVFASIFAHGASSLEEVCQAPQVPRRVADFLRDNMEMT